MTGSVLIRALLLALLTLALVPAAQAQSAGQGSAPSGGPSGDSSSAAPAEAWFRTGKLNPGLAPPPDDLDRATPMGAVESFLDAIHAGRWERAAHLLDLGRLPPAEQALRGPELARQLGVMVDTFIWLDWGDLPDRPDALVEGGVGSTPRAGERRRSLVIGELELDGRPIPIRIRRVKPEGADAVWVFAPQTVDRIELLYRQHGPGWIHEALPQQWQEHGWWGLQKWEFVALPTVLVAATAIFTALRWMLGRLSTVTPWPLLSRTFRAARTPLALLAAAVPLYWATLHLVTFSAPVRTVLSPLLIAAIVIAVAMALLSALDKVIDILARRWLGDPDDEYDQHQRQVFMTLYAIRRVVLLAAIVVGLGVVLTQLNAFSAVGISVLASAGVLTVILGIAAQPVLGNILASLQIALSKPIRIGDAVSYEGRWAYVEAIFYTFVRLRTWDDRRLVVPVQYFTSHPFENYSMIEKKMTRVFLIYLDHRADVEELRRFYLDMARADEDTMPEEMLKVLVVEHDHTGMCVRFYCTAKDASTAWNLHCRLREQVLAWIRDNHPEWWPRQRQVQFNTDGPPAASYGEAAE